MYVLPLKVRTLFLYSIKKYTIVHYVYYLGKRGSPFPDKFYFEMAQK